MSCSEVLKSGQRCWHKVTQEHTILSPKGVTSGQRIKRCRETVVCDADRLRHPCSPPLCSKSVNEAENKPDFALLLFFQPMHVSSMIYLSDLFTFHCFTLCRFLIKVCQKVMSSCCILHFIVAVWVERNPGIQLFRLKACLNNFSVDGLQQSNFKSSRLLFSLTQHSHNDYYKTISD